MKHLHGEWLKQATENIATLKARELAKVDGLERTYWAAWERSCREAKRKSLKTEGTITREITDPDGSTRFVQQVPAEQVLTTEERVGDKRYLEGVQWCIDRRCKILGVDAPLKVAPTAPTGDKAFDGIERGAARFTEYINRILAYRDAQENSGPGAEGGTPQN
ncbi:MAG: hypothetical protein BWY79_01776 [Actinobacteria bacterium ADurb.Bin444]|nr:MAG: hypothetical protein BWY79_01776 [Actinobacteria bacterium ADurb.Bin444]